VLSSIPSFYLTSILSPFFHYPWNRYNILVVNIEDFVMVVSKKKILVVDDSPIMGLVIGNIISEDPLLQVVEYASDGLDALAKVGTVKPDLIILDLQMPKMNGVEFMKQVRSKSNAKVLVVTAEDPSSPIVAQAKALGVNEILFKPSGAVSAESKAQRSQEIRGLIRRILNI
jgi:two-component system chemotaxis response regulator CheB